MYYFLFQRYQTDGLGSWVAHIREQYKKKDLSDVKIKLLESIGFVWRLRESKWSDMYAALKAFKEGEHHMISYCFVSLSFILRCCIPLLRTRTHECFESKSYSG